MPIPVILDTDILSALMRGEPSVDARARIYLAQHGTLSFSIITRYEILRGLRAKGATSQLAAFDRLSRRSEVVPLTDDVVVRAAEIYAVLRRGGATIGDADILIAATALVHGRPVVTNNEEHFRRVPDLVVENWLAS